MSKFVTYPAVTVLDDDQSLLIDSPSAGTNSITAENAGSTLLSKWAGFETFDEAVQNTISNNQEFIDRDTAIREETAELKKKIVTTFPAKEASGAVATFESEFEDAPLKSCIVQIEPVQAGSGDPSPENVRPITGWTGCEVQRTGVNLFGGEAFAYAVKAVGDKAQIDKDEKTFTFTRSVKGEDDSYNRIIKPIKAKTITVIITYSNTARNNCLRISYSDGTSDVIDLNNSNNQKTTIAVTSNTSKIVDSITLSYFSSNATKVYYEESGVFEGTVTADDFVPYTGQTYPITFPSEAGTVYGGSLDVLNGVLTVEMAMVDLGTLTWLSGGVRFSAYVSNLPNKLARTVAIICTKYAALCNNEPYPSKGEKVIYGGNSRVYVHDNTYTDAESFKEAMSGVQLCYELATPIHYPITANQINSLLGTNNIWADTGDVSVEYLMSDVSWYVEKKFRAFQSILAGVEDSTSASKNYSANTYLIFNNDIYRVTKAITAGETIEEGVNVTKTTVAEQLMALAQA